MSGPLNGPNRHAYCMAEIDRLRSALVESEDVNELAIADVARLRAELARDRAEDEALQVSLSRQADAIIELNAEVADLRAQLSKHDELIANVLRTAQVWHDLGQDNSPRLKLDYAEAHRETLRFVAGAIREQLS